MKYPWIQYTIILAYFIFIFTKGIRRSRDIDDSDDFLVAGRNIGWFFLLCTIGAPVKSINRIGYIFIFIWLKRIQKKCRLMSAKGGLMMGTKKVGALSSRLKKAIYIIA